MSVRYNGHVVSDSNVRAALEKISGATGRSVNVTSGDRNFVPAGGARNSDHLKKRVADFHLEGIADEGGFAEIRNKGAAIFGSPMTFQLIRHGPHTQTEGAHIHLGDPEEGSPRCGFWTEGLTPGDNGH